MALASGRCLSYTDPRRFGLMLLVKESELAAHPLLRDLGPEPLLPSFSARYLAQALASRKGPIKTALMDAHLVVGVGNIYASEALFEARLSPQMAAFRAVPYTKKLVSAIRKVLRAAIRSGGSSLRDFFDAEGNSGYFQHQFQVYGREDQPCRACKTPIRKITQAGRSTFFCPRCQNSHQPSGIKKQ